MRFLLKLLRIFFIFLVPIVILGAVFENIYINMDNGAEKYSWISLIAIFIFMYVLDRNKYQFNGWDEGKGKEKLSKKNFFNPHYHFSNFATVTTNF